jgi:hypothetical protein
LKGISMLHCHIDGLVLMIKLIISTKPRRRDQIKPSWFVNNFSVTSYLSAIRRKKKSIHRKKHISTVLMWASFETWNQCCKLCPRACVHVCLFFSNVIYANNNHFFILNFSWESYYTTLDLIAKEFISIIQFPSLQ